MAKEILIGTNKVKKIFVGTTPVKKVYVGTTLCWSAAETGSWHAGTETTNFGANQFRLEIKVTIKEKDYAENRMKIDVEVGMRSLGGYSTVTSTNRTSSLYIEGNKYDYNYTAGIAANSYKTLYTKTDYWVNAASSKTIKLSTKLNLNFTVSGVGNLGSPEVIYDLKLPAL